MRKKVERPQLSQYNDDGWQNQNSRRSKAQPQQKSPSNLNSNFRQFRPPATPQYQPSAPQSPKENLTDMYDFVLAQKWPEEPVYMGSFHGDFGDRKNNLATKKVYSEEEYLLLPFAKNICCPEAPYRPYRSEDDNGNWSYEKNKAYWAGAIVAKREFHLLTPLKFYDKKMAMNNGGGTVSELLWLSDNHYTFEYDNEVLVAKPPEGEAPNLVMRSYATLNNTKVNERKIIAQAIGLFRSKIPPQENTVTNSIEPTVS